MRCGRGGRLQTSASYTPRGQTLCGDATVLPSTRVCLFSSVLKDNRYSFKCCFHLLLMRWTQQEMDRGVPPGPYLQHDK